MNIGRSEPGFPGAGAMPTNFVKKRKTKLRSRGENRLDLAFVHPSISRRHEILNSKPNLVTILVSPALIIRVLDIQVGFTACIDIESKLVGLQ